MKVERYARKTWLEAESGKRISVDSSSNVDFRESLTVMAERVGEEETGRLCERVWMLGRALADHQSLLRAEQYREAIRSLVRHIVQNGIRLSVADIRDRYGKRKLYAALQEIDQQLLELLQNTIENQNEPLHILHILGEAKGLLISLRM